MISRSFASATLLMPDRPEATQDCASRTKLPSQLNLSVSQRTFGVPIAAAVGTVTDGRMIRALSWGTVL